MALGAAPAWAQVGDCQRNRSWTTERLGKDHFKLIGQVEIECGEQSFAADEVELFTDTHKLIAIGNVVFTSGSSRIAADRLDYNTETRTGIFHNATGTAVLKDTNKSGPPQERSMFGTSEPDVYFYGKTLEKIGREKYKITSGGFTTCVQPTPRWSLTSGTVLLNLEKYAMLTNSLFRVKGVPVLYLPVFYYPVNKEDRATGFLIPTYGTSTVRGQTLSNAFFWAINRSQDATLLHDWYSRTGQGMGAEYRYVASPGSEGQIRYYYLREHEAEYTDDGGATVTTPERRSYEVRGTMSQRLGKRVPGARPGRLLLGHHRPADLQPEHLRHLAPLAHLQRLGHRHGRHVESERGIRPQRDLLRHDAVDDPRRHAEDIRPALGQAAVRLAGVLLDGRGGRQFHGPAQDDDFLRR